MKKQTLLLFVGFALVALFFGSAFNVHAGCGACGSSHSHAAGPDVKISLNPCPSGGTKLNIHAINLEAAGIYSVWLVNKTPKMDMVGVGEAPYAFLSNAQGKGSFATTLSKDLLSNWQILKVVQHKDGNAENMDKANLDSIYEINVSDLLAKASSLKKKLSSEAGSYKAPEASTYKAPEARSY